MCRRLSLPARVRDSMLPSGAPVENAGEPLRVLVAAFGDPGHVFPAISLGRALARRGHEVTVETWGQRRAAVEGAGLDFTAADADPTSPPPNPAPAAGPHAADAARALLPLIERLDPAV